MLNRNFVVDPVFALLAMVAFTTGCGATDEQAIELSDEPVAEQQEAIWAGWTPVAEASRILGIARARGFSTPSWWSPGRAYAWRVMADGTGITCRSVPNPTNPVSLCSEATYPYSAGGFPLNTIRAIGMAHDTSQVYTWYSDATFSRGTSDNLTAVSGKASFTVPAGFNMNELVEADNSDNGKWYFYWLQNGTLFRTTGTSNNGSWPVAPAQAVTHAIPSHGQIVGISFADEPVGPSRIEAWYFDGARNTSGSSLNLAEL